MTTNTDDVLVRCGRWALGKVWFGCVLSGGYAVGRHYHWPEAFLTAAAVLGAVALALASSFLPVWTRQRPSGIPVVDVGLRVMVWAGLGGSVLALLIGMPAVGMVAAALLFNTAARTFGDPFTPVLRRLRITPPVAYRPPGRTPAVRSRSGDRRDGAREASVAVPRRGADRATAGPRRSSDRVVAEPRRGPDSAVAEPGRGSNRAAAGTGQGSDRGSDRGVAEPHRAPPGSHGTRDVRTRRIRTTTPGSGRDHAAAGTRRVAGSQAAGPQVAGP